MASAGIDASNVDRTQLVLLPEDPDASARALRAALRERHGLDVAVDHLRHDGPAVAQRPDRRGARRGRHRPIRDHRGEVDPYGNELHDHPDGRGRRAGRRRRAGQGQVRPGAGGGGAGLPARHRARTTPGRAPALVRDAAQDLFSLGTAEARAAGLRDAATLADGPGPTPADLAAVRRAIDAVAEVVAPGTVFTLVDEAEVRAGLVAEMPGWPDGAALLLGSAPTPVEPIGSGPLRRRPAPAARRPGRRGRRVDPAAATARQPGERRARALKPGERRPAGRRP